MNIRFNFNVQKQVVDYIAHNSQYCTGTSNCYLAMKYGMKPMGTHPHEWFMFHGAQFGYKHANYMALENWVNVYDGDLGIALTDTYTSNVFFNNFSRKHAKLFDGIRQDSGDEFKFVMKAIARYKELGVDPTTKTIVFSNALDFEKAKEINEYCGNRIRKSKNQVELRAYKNLKAEIQILQTAKNAKPYDEAAEIQLISKMCKKLEDDILGFSEAGREDLASEYRDELEVLKKLLPEPVTQSEIMLVLWEWANSKGLLVQFNENPNNFSEPRIPKKEMGNAIKHIKSKFPQADGKMIPEFTERLIEIGFLDKDDEGIVPEGDRWYTPGSYHFEEIDEFILMFFDLLQMIQPDLDYEFVQLDWGKLVHPLEGAGYGFFN